jgi:hypothetical protein
MERYGPARGTKTETIMFVGLPSAVERKIQQATIYVGRTTDSVPNAFFLGR